MSSQQLENLIGSIFWVSVGRPHAGFSSDVTLAFEDAQGIQPFSGEAG